MSQLSSSERETLVGECSFPCPLKETCVTVNMPGKGPENAQIMVVVDSPEGAEDVRGAPFSGKTAALLETLFTDAGIRSDVIYITYAVKCRSSRKPIGMEIAQCRAHLAEEIQRLKPRIIIAMGDTSLHALCGTSGVTTKRGTPLALHTSFRWTADVICTYSPKIIFKQPLLRKTIVGDLRRAKDGLQGPDEIQWELWDTTPLEGDVWAYDIETDIKTGVVTQLGVSNGTRTVIERDYPLAAAARLLTRYGRSKTLVGHNSFAFDGPVLRANGVPVPLGEDTMALAYLIDETQPRGLEALCQKYLGVRGWKSDRDAEPGTDTFAAYNARDALYTWRLYYVLRNLLIEQGRLGIYEHLIKPARASLDECTRRGIHISAAAVASAEEHYGSRVADTERRLRELVGDEKFNPRSSNSVANYLQAEGHTLPTTPSGQPATGKLILSSLPKTALVKALLEHRTASKAVSAFVRPYKKALEKGDRVHPEYTLFQLTGRTSARNPNPQQLPREPLLRAFFDADDGFDLVGADYAAIEFRLALYLAGEHDYVRRLSEGFDPHRYLASLFYEIPEEYVTKLQRQVAKSANFGLCFLGTGHTLKDYAAKQGIKLSQATCQGLYYTFHRAYPRFTRWYSSVLADLTTRGYTETLTGRRRNFGEWHLIERRDRLECLRQAVNFQVQSLAADICLTALQRLLKAGYACNLMWHDAVYMEVPAGNVKQCEAEITRLMVDDTLCYLHEHFPKVPLDLPLSVEVKVGE